MDFLNSSRHRCDPDDKFVPLKAGTLLAKQLDGFQPFSTATLLAP